MWLLVGFQWQLLGWWRSRQDLQQGYVLGLHLDLFVNAEAVLGIGVLGQLMVWSFAVVMMLALDHRSDWSVKALEAEGLMGSDLLPALAGLSDVGCKSSLEDWQQGMAQVLARNSCEVMTELSMRCLYDR